MDFEASESGLDLLNIEPNQTADLDIRNCASRH